MSYEEEKKYLVEKAKEFLGDAEVVWLEDVKVFCLNGMSDEDVNVAMMYAKELADDIDNLHWKFAQMCGTE